jgi:hypothetical protein
MRLIVASFAFALASCGPDLGNHEFVSARYAGELPADYSHSRNDPGYVVLTFRTNADVNHGNVNALYAMADPCKASGDGKMTAFGPFTVSNAPQELPLLNSREAVAEYLVYVPVTGEIWGDLGKDGKTPVVGTFDLSKNADDVCFYLEHTGYPTATHSNVVRVAAPVFKRAIASVAP